MPRHQQQRVGMMVVHVLNDARREVRQRIGRGGSVIIGRHPPHHAKSAHVVRFRNGHAVEREITEIHPHLGLRMPFQVTLAHRCQIAIGHLGDGSQQRESRAAEGVFMPPFLAHQQARPRVAPQVAGVHRQRTDQERRTPLAVQTVRHDRAERPVGVALGQRRQHADTPDVHQGARLLGQRRPEAFIWCHVGGPPLPMSPYCTASRRSARVASSSGATHQYCTPRSYFGMISGVPNLSQ